MVLKLQTTYRFAVRLFKENFVVSLIEHYVRMTQMSRKSTLFPKNEFSGKFRKVRILQERKHSTANKCEIE